MKKGSASSARASQAGMPELSDKQLRVMRPLGRPPLGNEARQLIAIRLDAEVLRRLREEAERRKIGYQTLVNDVLANYVKRIA